MAMGHTKRHIWFIVSAIGIAWVDRMTQQKH